MDSPDYKEGMFCWNELGTSDTQSAAGFYTALIGWQTREKEMPGGAGIYTLLRVNDQDAAGMYELKGPMFEGVPPHWLGYVWVNDCDASAKKISELGGTIVLEPMDIEGVGRIAVGADPTGAHFGLFQGSEHKGAACAPAGPVNGQFCWNECMTKDAATAKTFYTSLFGWTAVDQDMGGQMYTMMMMGETAVAGLMALPPEMAEIPPHWGAYITVDDCDSKANQIEKLGGRVLVPPTDIPTIGRFSALSDPQGATVSIIKLFPRES